MRFEDDFTSLLREYPEAISEKKRLLALLRDLFPAQQKQINLLSTAFDLGIAKEIAETQRITSSFAYRFVKRLINEYGVGALNADWVVSMWCICYGQRVLRKPCDIQISSDNGGTVPVIKDSQSSSAGKQYADLFRYVRTADGYGIAGFDGENERTLIFPNQYRGNAVKRIMAGAFAESAAQEAVMTDGITVIAERAFCGCIGLKQVVFPQTLKAIGNSAFAGCAALAAAVLPMGVEQIGAYAFAGTGIKQVVLPPTVLWIGEGAYADCKRLSQVTMPDSIDRIPSRMFHGCVALKGVKLPVGIVAIEKDAFRGCATLESMMIPATVQRIGEDVFTGCGTRFTLLCQKDTIAEQYARSNHLAFQYVY